MTVNFHESYPITLDHCLVSAHPLNVGIAQDSIMTSTLPTLHFLIQFSLPGPIHLIILMPWLSSVNPSPDFSPQLHSKISNCLLAICISNPINKAHLQINQQRGSHLSPQYLLPNSQSLFWLPLCDPGKKFWNDRFSLAYLPKPLFYHRNVLWNTPFPQFLPHFSNSLLHFLPTLFQDFSASPASHQSHLCNSSPIV